MSTETSCGPCLLPEFMGQELTVRRGVSVEQHELHDVLFRQCEWEHNRAGRGVAGDTRQHQSRNDQTTPL